MSNTKLDRRNFLTRSAGILAAGTTAPYFWSSSCAKAESKNDRLNVGSIGTSTYRDRWGSKGLADGRGAVIGHQAGGLGNMVACCDVDRRHAERFASRYKGKCRIYSDFRKLLERKDIDVVTIGTPDHWHTAIAIAAMKAGKDVYCEKPLTLTIDEGKQICRTVRQTGRVFQVGTQQRSEYGSMFLKAVALARSGRLGKTLVATSSVGPANRGGPFKEEAPPAYLDWDFWLGQAPKVPFIKQRCHYEFRWWLEYSGGQVTDWGVHHTDIALWATGGENTGPVEVEGSGDFPKIKNGYNVATTFKCTMKLPNGNKIILDSGDNNLLIEGDKGRIAVNRGHLNGKPIEELSESDKEWLDQEVIKLYGGKKPGSHMGNFFECVKDRSLPVSDVFTHHRSVSACHLCDIAMRLGRKLRWDPDKEDFIGDQQASAMLSRKQREPYTIEKLTS